MNITTLFLHGGLKMNNCFIWKSLFKIWDAEMCVASLNYKKKLRIKENLLKAQFHPWCIAHLPLH